MVKPFYGKPPLGPCWTELIDIFLSSSIVENIINLHKTNPSIAYAYFFFDGRDSQTSLQLHDKLIRSLITQLSSQCDGIPATLVELYGHGQQQPSMNSLQHTLYVILNGLNSVYIIIDALDECTERDKVLSWIRQIVFQNVPNLHIIVTSRPEREIEDVLQPLDLGCVDIVRDAENVDIEKYIDQELQTDHKLNRWEKVIQEDIKMALITGAQGMYVSYLHLRYCH